jgi:hypothetical protein
VYASYKGIHSMLNDTRDIQILRALSSGLDLRRPVEDRLLENYFEILTSGDANRASVHSYLPHSDLVYCRAALEAKFPDRIFALQEVKDLILEVYGIKYT